MGHRTARGISWLSVPLAALLGVAGLGPIVVVGRQNAAAHAGATTATAALRPAIDPALRTRGDALSVIVQAVPGRERTAAEAIAAAGGRIDAALPLVNGFTATVPTPIRAALSESTSVRSVTSNRKIAFEDTSYDAAAAGAATGSNFARTSGATAAWAAGSFGDGVGVAVLDTGIAGMNDFNGRVVYGPDLSGEGTTIDSYGHGTVMAGLIGGSGADSSGRGAYTGVAPKATLVAVKTAGRNGTTDVSAMLQAMHWVSAYKDQYNIRVLNLSWGTPSTQSPSSDPLNYAVERLWKQGIVVVVAAGNAGPNPGTVLKPGDDPAVITAGAYDDKGNRDRDDDTVPAWSSRGPTPEGVAKPDIVAPGRTLIATRSYGSSVEQDNPKALIAPSYIKGSGTSQAAAVTSGVAALLISKRPDLTPDQVKYLLRSTASRIDDVGARAQGAGRIRGDLALNASVAAAPVQQLVATGLGSLDASRGGIHLQADCAGDGTLTTIQGEITSRCQPWDPNAWTGTSWTGTSWTGTSWTGTSWTGTSWTGTSWTGTSWTGTSWTGGTWTGTSWTGTSWTGTSWTGTSWTGTSWTGTSWTGTSWTGTSWTGTSWTGASWMDGLWMAAVLAASTATHDHDHGTADFMTVFWGNHPGSHDRVVGESKEQSDLEPSAKSE